MSENTKQATQNSANQQSKQDIERLVEQQSKGETAQSHELATEQLPPAETKELDNRDSKGGHFP